MQCSWVKRLFEDDFHDWKVIPLFLIGKHLGKNFKFHNNIDISNDILSKFPSFYQDIFVKWINNFNKLTSKELYLNLVEANTVKPTAQDYLENFFETSQFI